MTSKAFVDAIQNARIIMNYGIQLGFTMNLLDIGGGFPGNTGTECYFSEIATAVNTALEEHFPNDGSVQIIAEPGRYYVASAYSLATNVIATREMVDPGLLIRLMNKFYFSDIDTSEMKYMYYINDGVYGSFNCVLYDHYVPEPSFLANVCILGFVLMKRFSFCFYRMNQMKNLYHRSGDLLVMVLIVFIHRLEFRN
jgi:ornithine decarboxylase